MIGNYPPSINIGRWGGVLLAVFSGVLPFAIWSVSLGPLGRFYLGSYARSAVPSFAANPPAKVYPVLTLSGGSPAGNLPCPTDANLPTSATPLEKVAPLETCLATVKDRAFHEWMRTGIFGGRSLPALVRTPLIVWATLGSLFVALGIAYDIRRRRQLVLRGDQVRGPEMKTPGQYNRKMLFGRDGIRIVLASGHKKVDF